mmetsp:Transcript_28616/g.33260  ORF Transcript_28616/g.33260 Transcript_28616/m.33260 type:complete len:436 (+) Transcript_28616:77-1384(+)
MAKKSNKPKTEKPPAVDKLLKPTIGVVLALLGYYFMKGLDIEIPRIDVNDELALREVFFGEGEGKNHVVLCNTLPSPESNSKQLPISSVFQDSMDELHTTNIADFALIDCTHTLPSGTTIADKFKLNLKKRPTIFVSGKVGPPKQIPEKHLKTGHMLTKLLKSMLEPHAAKILSTKDLKSKCLNSNYCGLLLKGGSPEKYVKDAFKNLLEKYDPKVQFASIDSTTMLLSGLEEHIPEFKAGQHRFVLFKKISGGLNEKDGRLITSIVTLDESESLSFNSISSTISSAMKGSKSAKKLSSLPQVKTRTKKLEEAERAKRQRKENAANGKKTSSSSTTHTGENDGSKEGRKAERERRREEHRKSNPNFVEKTPEEIAEIERKRRQRMEEESAKWNIDAEDLPEEGEPIDDSEYDYMDGDDAEDDEDGDDSEDIMDLD